MYFKFKVNNMPGIKGVLTYFTEADNFAEAAQRIIGAVGTGPAEIEEIKLMKNIKPALNEKTSETNKLYMIKIAEDSFQDNGTMKTIKYELPVFADNTDEVQSIVKDYISQGLETMRLTTISETKWLYI